MSYSSFPPGLPPYRLSVPTFPPQSGSDPVPPTTGLQLRLRADLGVTLDGNENVNSWTDQSPNGFVLQSYSVASRSPVAASVINGKPGVSFVYPNANENGYYNATGNPLPANSPRQCIIIGKTGSSTNGVACSFHRYQAGGHQAYSLYACTAAGVNYIYSDLVAATQDAPLFTYQPNTAYCLEYTWSGVQADLTGFSANHVAYPAHQTSGSGTNDGGDVNGFTIGNITTNAPAPYGAQGWNGGICEVLVYDHVLTVPQQAEARAYISAWYGL